VSRAGGRGFGATSLDDESFDLGRPSPGSGLLEVLPAAFRNSGLSGCVCWYDGTHTARYGMWQHSQHVTYVGTHTARYGTAHCRVVCCYFGTHNMFRNSGLLGCVRWKCVLRGKVWAGGYVCMRMCMRMYVCMRMCVRMYVCACVCVCISIQDINLCVCISIHDINLCMSIQDIPLAQSKAASNLGGRDKPGLLTGRMPIRCPSDALIIE